MFMYAIYVLYLSINFVPIYLILSCYAVSGNFYETENSVLRLIGRECLMARSPPFVLFMCATKFKF